jgi:hypothetical protein
VLVSGSLDAARAMPKSTSTVRPAGVSMMFAGLRSRWTTPASCAACSPSATCTTIDMTWSVDIGPFSRSSWARVCPSTSCITRKAWSWPVVRSSPTS